MKKRFLIPTLALGGALLVGGGAYFGDEINCACKSITGVETTEAQETGGQSVLPSTNIDGDLEQIKKQLTQIKVKLYPEDKEKEYQSPIDFNRIEYMMSKDYLTAVVNDNIRHLEGNLDPITRNDAAYLRCTELLPQLQGKQLAELNSRIWDLYSQNEVTPEKKEQFVSQSIDFFLESMDETGMASLQQKVMNLEDRETYQKLLKTKPLDFWLEGLMEVYEVKFSK